MFAARAFLKRGTLLRSRAAVRGGDQTEDGVRRLREGEASDRDGRKPVVWEERLHFIRCF